MVEFSDVADAVAVLRFFCGLSANTVERNLLSPNPLYDYLYRFTEGRK